MASSSNMDIEGATQHLRDILKLDLPANSAGKLPGKIAARPRRDDVAQRLISAPGLAIPLTILAQKLHFLSQIHYVVM